MAHPHVAEAVSFGAPNAKYGEVVAAAVVPKPGAPTGGPEAAAAFEEDVRQFCSKRLAAFKVGLMV